MGSALKLPNYTCPDIDKMIRKVRAIEKALGKYPCEEVDNANALLEEIEYEISGFEDDLERLRSSNEELRAEAEKVPGLEDEIASLEQEIKEIG